MTIEYKARITDMGALGKPSYTVSHETECRDGADLSAYRTAGQLNDTIQMGMILVEPLSDDFTACGECGTLTDNPRNRRTGEVTCDECEDTAQAGAAMRDPHYRARYGD